MSGGKGRQETSKPSQEQRERLLEQVGRLAHREAENTGDPIQTFLPLVSHQLALRPDTVVIRGGRGAGKSALFSVVQKLRDSARMRLFFDDAGIADADWIDGFSQLHLYHPDVLILDEFARKATDLAIRAFWLAHLLRRLAAEVPDAVTVPSKLDPAVTDANEEDPFAWMRTAEAELSRMAAAIDQAERRLEERRRKVFVVYDHLDRIGAFDPEVRRRCVGTLMALWLSLSNRYRCIRGKLFLREDLLDAAELRFPDASKLRARSISIDWDMEALFRVVVRHLAAASEDMRTWLSGTTGLVLQDRGEFGWMPGRMPDPVQKAFAARLTGAVVGRTELDKAAPHQWIPNRIKDAHGRMMPRSMLCLLGFAAEAEKKKPQAKGVHLLTSDALHAGLEDMSFERMNEVKEEYPIVRRLENLAGGTIPLPRNQMQELVNRPVPAEDKYLSRDGELVLKELSALGLVSLRQDGTVDLPDLYRYALKVRRLREPAPRIEAPRVVLEQAHALRDKAKEAAGEERNRLFEQVIEKYSLVTAHLPDSAAAWTGLGDAQRLWSEFQMSERAIQLLQEAERAYERALDHHPGWCNALVGWGQALMELGLRRPAQEAEDLFRQATSRCEQASEEMPNYYNAYLVWGEVLTRWSMRKPKAKAGYLIDQARQLFQSALEVKPDSYMALLRNGFACYEGGRRNLDGDPPAGWFQEARSSFLEAWKLKPDLYVVFDHIGILLAEWADTHRTEMIELAIESLRRALARKPDFFAAMNHWGHTLLRRADIDPSPGVESLQPAIQQYEQALQIEPLSYEAHAGMGMALLRRATHERGETQRVSRTQAEERLHHADKIMPGSGSFGFACLNALHHSEGECRRWFERAFDYGHVPSRRRILATPELADYQDKDWFHQRVDEW